MEIGSCPLQSEDSVKVKSLSSDCLFYFSNLPAFILISDSRLLLLRPIRIYATHLLNEMLQKHVSITVLVSASDHVTLADIYSYLPLLLIL